MPFIWRLLCKRKEGRDTIFSAVFKLSSLWRRICPYFLPVARFLLYLPLVCKLQERAFSFSAHIRIKSYEQEHVRLRSCRWDTETRAADPDKHFYSPTDSPHELCQIFDFLLFPGLCTHLAESNVARQNISVSISSQDFWMLLKWKVLVSLSSMLGRFWHKNAVIWAQ